MRRSLSKNAGVSNTPPRDMLAAGIDIIPDKKNNLGAKREKKGQCPTCGAQTHKVSMIGKKKPLTKEGLVYQGRCLKCHPLEGYIRRPPENGSPRQLPVHNRHTQPQYQNHQQQRYQRQQQQQHVPQQQHIPQQMMHQPPQQQAFSPEPLQVHMDNPPQHLSYQQPIQQQIHTSMPQPRQQQTQYNQPQHHVTAESGIAVPRTLEVLRMDDDNVSVITMDYRIAHGARNFTPSEGIDYDSVGEEGMPLPLPKGRPGPDSGDDYNNRNRQQAPQVHQSGPDLRPPIRTMPSYSRNPSIREMQGRGVVRGGPSAGGMQMPPEGSIRNLVQQAQNPMPRRSSSRQDRVQQSQRNMAYPPQEHHPEAHGGYMDQQHPDEYYANHDEYGQEYHEEDYNEVGQEHRAGFDKDGYPIASEGYGWDNQADMLPPGGMDSLLRNRTGEAVRPIHKLKLPPKKSNPAGEIEFQPSNVSPPPADMSPQRSVTRHAPPPREAIPMTAGLDRQVSSGRSPPRSQQTPLPKPFARDSRIMSMESGPSYQQDDFPDYDMDGPTAASALSPTRLRTQASGPAYLAAGMNRASGRLGATSARNETHNGMSSGAAPSLRTSKTFGPSALPRYDSHAPSLDSTTLSNAPPLVSRDQRGRPDSIRIQDPSLLTSHTMSGHLRPPSERPNGGGLIDDDEESANDLHPPLSEVPRRRSGVAKAPPPQYAPELSPEIDQPRVLGMTQDQLVSLSHAGLDTTREHMGDVLEDEASHEVMEMPNLDHQQSQHYDAMPAPPAAARHQSSADFKTPAAVNRVPETATGPQGMDQMTAMMHGTSLKQRSTLPQARFDETNNASRTSKRVGREEVESIPIHLESLNSGRSSAEVRLDALHNLADALWKGGDPARDIATEHNGIEALVKTMWNDIGEANLQDAALDVLLAIATSSDGEEANDLLANEESFCDALLFSMQMHSQVQSIQLKGCNIFAALSVASATNRNISDGSLSGALLMILNALNNHRQSLGVQKAGLQALYYQCTTSSNSESNRRSLVESYLDTGISGIDVLANSMQCIQEDVAAMEWGCRLCWSLSSSQYEEVVKGMSGNPMLLQEIVQTCARHIQAPDGFTIIEACFGAIGNLAHVERNRADLQDSGATELLVQGMKAYRGSESINIEACSAIANLAVSTSIRDTMVKAGGVGIILRAIEAYVENPEFVGEALRALVCLAIHSLESKEAIAVPDVIELIADVSARHQESNQVQEMCCILLGTLAVGRATSDIIIEGGGLDLIVRALKLNTDEKVQDAACMAYRNLSCQVQDSDPLMQQGALRLIVQAMAKHEGSTALQRSSCCAIWNLAFKTKKAPGTILGYDGVQAIVKAMQNHMESAELLEVACGALWSLVDDSIDRKKDVVGNGAIDAVVCSLVMHPTTTPTLIKACGVFSNISFEGPLAEAIANAQGISVLVDAIRNNGTSVSFLEVACLTLRNIIFQLPDCAAEASMAISTIIDAMKDNIDAIGFQQEACSLLWVLASEAESCHSKILALDGISVLMKCLEHNSYDSNVQEAALGAFNQLAATG